MEQAFMEFVNAFPRMCGGDPNSIRLPPTIFHFSPHVRG